MLESCQQPQQHHETRMKLGTVRLCQLSTRRVVPPYLHIIYNHTQLYICLNGTTLLSVIPEGQFYSCIAQGQSTL
jgi:hypothetical protein